MIIIWQQVSKAKPTVGYQNLQNLVEGNKLVTKKLG